MLMGGGTPSPNASRLRRPYVNWGLRDLTSFPVVERQYPVYLIFNISCCLGEGGCFAVCISLWFMCVFCCCCRVFKLLFRTFGAGKIGHSLGRVAAVWWMGVCAGMKREGSGGDRNICLLWAACFMLCRVDRFYALCPKITPPGWGEPFLYR